MVSFEYFCHSTCRSNDASLLVPCADTQKDKTLMRASIILNKVKNQFQIVAFKREKQDDLWKQGIGHNVAWELDKRLGGWLRDTANTSITTNMKCNDE